MSDPGILGARCGAAVVVALSWLAGGAGAAWACGGGVVGARQATLGGDVQRVLVSVGASSTDVITQLRVPEPGSDFGVLLPLPGRPTLDPQPFDSTELADLDQQTAPRILAGGPGDAIGCVWGGGSASEKGTPVVGPALEIGPVTAVVLDASDAAALDGWLAANGFAIPDEHRALVGEYTAPGRFFLALRRSVAAGSTAAESIGVHFTLPGDQRALPLRFARLGAAARVMFTVLVAAPGVVAPRPPFTTLTLGALDSTVLLRDRAAYPEAVARAVAAAHGQAFVIEGALDIATLTLSRRLRDVLGINLRLTRLSTVVDAAALSTDADFTDSYSGPVPHMVLPGNPRDFQRFGLGSASPVGALTLLGLGLTRRTWRPRRRR